MINAIHAEWIKLRTTRAPIAIATSACVLAALIAVAQLFPGAQTGQDPATAGTQRNIFSAGGQIANILVLVVSTLVVTGEYRFGTIASTFLAEPRRLRVVSAKVVAAATAGTVLAVAAGSVALAAAGAGLRLKGDAIVLSWREVAGLVAWPIAQAPGWALLGVAGGLIVRNQVGALVGLFVWSLVGESLISAVVPAVADYLPVAALGAIGVRDSISTWASAGIALGWLAGLIAAGALLTVSRDIN